VRYGKASAGEAAVLQALLLEVPLQLLGVVLLVEVLLVQAAGLPIAPRKGSRLGEVLAFAIFCLDEASHDLLRDSVQDLVRDLIRPVLLIMCAFVSIFTSSGALQAFSSIFGLKGQAARTLVRA